jgi:UDP-N-acetylmuramate dehydrogenase
MSYRIHEHVLLSPMTTFRIGGPARWLIDVMSVSEIRKAIAFAKEQDVPYTLIAGGSNVLVADAGVRGVVIHLYDGRHRIAGDFIYAEAGTPLETLMRESAAAGLSGWESLAGIPGSIGGAVRGNAGAFGTEIADVVEAVRAYNTQTDQLYDFEKGSCEFAYRESIFKKDPRWIITQVILKLTPGDSTESHKNIQKTIAEREKRHIQKIRAAGSFFKNPAAPPAVRALYEYEKKTLCEGRRVPAGWLIEKVGAKGASIGGAASSEQHPNYLINSSGDALSSDVLSLAEQLQTAVFERYKINLEPEVSLIGFGS